MSESIPHCNELFLRYFAPRYADWQEKWHDMTTTRADLAGYDELKGHSAIEVSPLEDDYIREYIEFLDGSFTTGAVNNIARDLSISPPVTMKWIERIDQYYNVHEIARLIAASDPEDEENPYFLRAIEVGAIIAIVLRQLIPDLE